MALQDEGVVNVTAVANEGSNPNVTSGPIPVTVLNVAPTMDLFEASYNPIYCPASDGNGISGRWRCNTPGSFEMSVFISDGDGGNNNFISFGEVQAVAVPEPPAMSLATMALLGLGWLATRRRRH